MIAGGGVIGTKLAVYLSQRGEKVTLVDRDKNRCEWVSKHSDAIVYRGNVLDPAILSEAEITKADSLIVALGNDDVARELVRLAKSQFAVPRVVAIAKDSEGKAKMERLGAESVVCTEDVVIDAIKGLLLPRGHRMLYHDNSGEYKIEQATVRATSSMLGKRISALGNRLAKVVGIVRAGTLLFPRDEMVLQMGDEVIVIGAEAGVSKVCAQIEA
jgi:trk system potassium uptake protein